MTNVSSCMTRIGDNHGYRFAGDFVHLNAEVSFSDADLTAGANWALQLWASEAGFFDGLCGVKLAEQAVWPVAGGVLVNAECAAMLPAGTADQALALALVAFVADGQAELRDLAVYPVRERFFQPLLEGNVSCALADGVAELNIDAIGNPRAADNLSGTLSLEVWALDAPYAGGSWVGVPVATVILGTLAGGEQWSACQFSVPAALPLAGAALTVMLREWTPAGYVTRDYRNIAALAAPVAVAVVPAEKVKPAATKKVPVAEAAKETAAEADKSAKSGKVAKPGKAAKAAKKAAAKSEARGVSVNTASEAELAAVKGLPPSVARAIVAARPFASLEEVCKAKGMGPKMLAKLRDQLVL
ncbi:ComEA family DNA-binding protein [Quatrionicoccus australiensis]|uniref:ComEA family DNA-binding protein n=1 Tax=Quatrionicoccus australiensis TaxID=138118 RepID=UPI001CF9EA9E|nr:helix-hairpin-helix domain-containing protein [Quatrionicoccus australiensis]MCB4361033.1 helix-hairpin-helix domain-containing protein [Quatrionicoccus australiensis]